MSDNTPKATASVQITIEGNVSEREKQIIHLLLQTLHVTLMMPFAIKENESTPQDVRSAAHALAMMTLTVFAKTSFPDLNIKIHDSDIKDLVGLKAP